MQRRAFLTLAALPWVQGSPIDHDPYVPTPHAEVGRILLAVQLRRTDRVLELGSGDARIAAAVQQRGVQVRGIELDPARARIGRARGVDILEADYMLVDWSGVDVLITGDVSDGMRGPILRRFRRMARPGARLALGHAGLLALGLQVFVQPEDV